LSNNNEEEQELKNIINYESDDKHCPAPGGGVNYVNPFFEIHQRPKLRVATTGDRF
jgi:hypothetical protein